MRRKKRRRKKWNKVTSMKRHRHVLCHGYARKMMTTTMMIMMMWLPTWQLHASR